MTTDPTAASVSISVGNGTSSARLSHAPSVTSLASAAGAAIPSKSVPHEAASAKLVNRPTFLDYGNYRFLIMDAPTDQNLPAYIELLRKRHVTCVVRACEPSYGTGPLIREGIKVVELAFPDGEPPPDGIIDQWLALVDSEFGAPSGKGQTAEGDETKSTGNVIAVHCVAGLGRAPCLVAISLIEAGMAQLEAVEYIRKRRRGAINAKQISYLEKYQRRGPRGCCVIL